MGRKSYPALSLVLLLWLGGCKKDKPAAIDDHLPGATGNIYIVCEGNFGNGDASLYAFKPLTDSVYGDLYKAANTRPLGDVFSFVEIAIYTVCQRFESIQRCIA